MMSKINLKATAFRSRAVVVSTWWPWQTSYIKHDFTARKFSLSGVGGGGGVQL